MDIEKTIRAYLPQVVHMSLATSKDNKPWVCEVHFACDDNLNIYFRSSTSRRHSQEIAQNPNVAGNIVTQHFLNQPVRGVYFEGTAQVANSDEERLEAFKAMQARYQLEDTVFEESKKPDGSQFYKIAVATFYLFDSYTSKPSQKYELVWNGGAK
jgi:uncharacterized protein YhbP (UPF0306 family)